MTFKVGDVISHGGDSRYHVVIGKNSLGETILTEGRDGMFVVVPDGYIDDWGPCDTSIVIPREVAVASRARYRKRNVFGRLSPDPLVDQIVTDKAVDALGSIVGGWVDDGFEVEVINRDTGQRTTFQPDDMSDDYVELNPESVQRSRDMVARATGRLIDTTKDEK